MQIEANKVVTFHYRLSEANKGQIEDSRSSNPIVYLHGNRSIIPGLEDALTGKKAGDNFTVTLEPELAYGQRNPEAQQRVSLKHIINPGNKKVHYKPGMVIQLNTAEGPREVMVIKVGLKTIDVDVNHPLAGKTLTFDIDVIDVRDASAEELDHGHVHGDGGHHH
jgi:FKBP-type peptidyl-prolyl cis-trans isomerase SlyD